MNSQNISYRQAEEFIELNRAYLEAPNLFDPEWLVPIAALATFSGWGVYKGWIGSWKALAIPLATSALIRIAFSPELIRYFAQIGDAFVEESGKIAAQTGGGNPVWPPPGVGFIANQKRVAKRGVGLTIGANSKRDLVNCEYLLLDAIPPIPSKVPNLPSHPIVPIRDWKGLPHTLKGQLMGAVECWARTYQQEVERPHTRENEQRANQEKRVALIHLSYSLKLLNQPDTTQSLEAYKSELIGKMQSLLENKG